MGVSKVILVDPNTQTPDVIMDVTGDDTSAGVLLAGNVGTRNDGEKVTGTIPEKTSSDLTASGATVTAPAGHYATAASKSVASGTAGTPTATKGSVSNHSVNVTPSVTNTTGYISGGTKTGTPVSVSASELVSGTKSIAANGTGIDVTNYASVDVAVPATPLQTKSVTPTESAQTVTPDSGYALSEVDVGAIPSDYVGSAIDRRDSTDLSLNIEVSGVTVTAPAGYYDETASESIPEGSVSNPDITVASDGMITVTQTRSAGYIRGGSATYRQPLSTQSGKTVSPTESEQTAVAAGKYTTGEVKVDAIPSDYVGSGVTRRTASDLTKSGALVFAPAGYYAEQVGKSVNYGSQGTPSISVDSDGLITASATDTTGYITGTTKTATEQLSTQPAATITPSETAQTAVAAGKYTTGAVTVDAIPSDYVGSAIDQRDSSDLTASGATVTAPAGYYEEAASKAVASGSAAAPASISGTGATVSAGTNTLTLSKTISVTPSVTPGYISAGTAGNSSVSLQASVTTKAAATITPGTSNQTIAAGTYLTGAQTIAGSANLVAGNIKSGVSIFGVTGTFAGDATVYKDAYTSGSITKGTATSMQIRLQNPTATSIDCYAIIAGGYSGSSSTSSNNKYAQAYSTSLVKTNLTSLTQVNHSGLTATAIAGMALIAGGGDAGYGSAVEYYSPMLVLSSATNLTQYRSLHAVKTIGEYALVAGGYTSSYLNSVETYSGNLTHSTTTNLNAARRRLAAAVIGTSVLFAGGENSAKSSVVDVYTTSLTHSVATALNTARTSLAGTSVGNYALFAGGQASAASNVVDTYDKNLTHSTATALNTARYTLAATSFDNLALFAGGYNSAVVDTYTSSLSHSTTTALSQARGKLGATTIGNYALFAGGDKEGSYSVSWIVDTYNPSYTLSVSVPANYTYTFNGSPPVTVSAATTVSTSSNSPINGAVFKAATTKTGKIT